MTTKVSNQPPTCFICVRVTTGTIVLALLFLLSGVYSAVLSTLVLAGVVDVNLNQDLSDEWGVDLSNYETSTMWIAFGNGLFVAAVAVFAIYGTVKNRSGCLLPLLILLTFELLCLLIFYVGVAVYWPNMKNQIAECKRLPDDMKQWLLSIDDRWLACIVYSLMFLKAAFKCYLIDVVYKCYKHIAIQAVLKARTNSEIPSLSSVEVGAPVYKPPKYEDIQKVPLVDDVDEVEDTKPPSYWP